MPLRKPKNDVTVPLSESSFAGEIRSTFAEDPLEIGFAASTAIEQAAEKLRVAAKALAEANGAPQPKAYELGVKVKDGFALTFNVTA